MLSNLYQEISQKENNVLIYGGYLSNLLVCHHFVQLILTKEETKKN